MSDHAVHAVAIIISIRNCFVKAFSRKVEQSDGELNFFETAKSKENQILLEFFRLIKPFAIVRSVEKFFGSVGDLLSKKANHSKLENTQENT